MNTSRIMYICLLCIHRKLRRSLERQRSFETSMLRNSIFNENLEKHGQLNLFLWARVTFLVYIYTRYISFRSRECNDRNKGLSGARGGSKRHASRAIVCIIHKLWINRKYDLLRRNRCANISSGANL